jgi:hypothetical protein
MRKLPKINIDELKADMEQNRKERLKFIDWYVSWMKTHSNKEWSTAQKKIIDPKK